MVRALQDTYIARMERLAGNVRESNPDIIAFQEVRHDAVRDSQPQRLSRTSEMDNAGVWMLIV